MLFLAITFTVFAQPERTFIHECTEEMDAYVVSDVSANGYVSVIVRPPTYYDLELVMLSVKIVAEKYTDVIMVRNWKLNEDGTHTVYYSVVETTMGVHLMKTGEVMFIYGL